jgi:hypothetical protein
MSSETPTVVEQLVESINQSKSFEAALLDLALIQEFRHWRAHIDTLPGAATLDAAARDRIAAQSTVEIVISFFEEPNRGALEKVADRLEQRLLKWAASKPKMLDRLMN